MLCDSAAGAARSVLRKEKKGKKQREGEGAGKYEKTRKKKRLSGPYAIERERKRKRKRQYTNRGHSAVLSVCFVCALLGESGKTGAAVVRGRRRRTKRSQE